MSRNNREWKMWWRIECRYCRKPFVACRLHAILCGPRCRKAASRLGLHYRPWSIGDVDKVKPLGTGRVPPLL